jgi:YjbE family integral membrane protein
MAELFSAPALSALVQVIMIDLVLAGDNAIVIGLAAAGLPRELRGKAIVVGIIAATVLRILFATVTIELLEIVGLLLAGGILLLWVSWKMWRELRLTAKAKQQLEDSLACEGGDADGLADSEAAPTQTFAQATVQIVLADISMSLDNVLAVAGAAHEHPVVLAIGLVLSITLMGVAASFIARLLNRHRWIAYAGLLIILYVALDMIWRGSMDVWPHVHAAAAAAID